MSFSVSNFKSNGLINGGARPSLFEVELTFPAGVVTGGIRDGGRFLIKAAQLPASDVGSVDVPYFGRKVKVAGDRTFADWTVTVMNDEDFLIRYALEDWSNKINQLEGNRMTTSSSIRPGQSGYKVDLTVRQFQKEQSTGAAPTPSVEYKFIGAFPTTIAAIGLDWDRTNAIEEFDVTFAYDYWIPSPTASGGNIYNFGAIAQ